MATGRSEGASDYSSAPLEPSANNGNGTESEPAAVECSACGHAGEPVGKGHCSKCGAFLPRNVAGMVHGGRREHPLANPEDAELFQDWAADLGGDLTAGQRAVLRRIAEADAVCQSALDYVLRSRESIASDRVQKALTVLATHASNLFRGARILGLERRARDVPSLHDYMGKESQNG